MYLTKTSVAETYKFIKQFHFETGFNRDPFEDLTFSDSTKIWLDTTDYSIKLKYDTTTGKFPDDNDIYFRTWTTNPAACRKLLMVQLFPNYQGRYGELYLRIYDGSNDYYWDGAAWSVAGAGDWNTEAEINANIETFTILPGRTFGITVNLRTTDPRLEETPMVSEIRVLMEITIDYLEDIVFRSLLPDMEENIRVTSKYAAIPTSSSPVSTINFGDYRKNVRYDITDVIGVYNITDDIDMLYNLFGSYNTSTEVITLSTPLPANKRVLILFEFQLPIIYSVHQDWEEVAKLPSIIVEQLDVPIAKEYAIAKETVIDKGTYSGWEIDTPIRVNLDFRIHILTNSVIDEMRILSQLFKYFDENKFVTSTGLDEYYRMYHQKEFKDITNSNLSDKRTAWTRFQIYDIRMPFKSRAVKARDKLTITFQEPIYNEEHPNIGGTEEVDNIHINGKVRNLEIAIKEL
jgi:hypothetical protein